MSSHDAYGDTSFAHMQYVSSMEAAILLQRHAYATSCILLLPQVMHQA